MSTINASAMTMKETKLPPIDSTKKSSLRTSLRMRDTGTTVFDSVSKSITPYDNLNGFADRKRKSSSILDKHSDQDEIDVRSSVRYKRKGRVQFGNSIGVAEMDPMQ